MGRKLVRDRVHEPPWRNESDKQFLRPVNGAEEHAPLLVQKLLEEVGEFLAVAGVEDPTFMIREAADVLQVMLTIIGGEPDDEIVSQILDEMARKHEELGGFRLGTVYYYEEA